MLIKCPPRGYEKWRLVQFFYQELTQSNRSMIKSMNGGAFLSLTGEEATIPTIPNSGIFEAVGIKLLAFRRREASMRLRRM
jgi:hypothetical protein